MTYNLSVILPVYNVETFLASCLDSLLRQSFSGTMQVILVEDKSTDNSLDVCRQYASRHDNFILIEHAENGGSAVARNTGLKVASGEYYVFVDPDDLLPEKGLEILYNYIHQSGADIVKGSNTCFSSANGEKKAPYSVNSPEVFHGDECLSVLLKHEKLRGHPWGKIFRSSTFSNDRFVAGYRMAQDLLYCAELFSKARHVLIVPDIVYLYRIHTAGATGRKYDTGAYLSWINCISEIQKFVTTRSQEAAYFELKIRTLTQLAREARGLDDQALAVRKKINEVEANWLPSIWRLIFKERISAQSIFRYLKFKRALAQIHYKK